MDQNNQIEQAPIDVTYSAALTEMVKMMNILNGFQQMYIDAQPFNVILDPEILKVEDELMAAFTKHIAPFQKLQEMVDYYQMKMN